MSRDSPFPNAPVTVTPEGITPPYWTNAEERRPPSLREFGTAPSLFSRTSFPVIVFRFSFFPGTERLSRLAPLIAWTA